MVVARPFAVFEFRLGDGGAKIDVPQGGRLAGVDLAAREHLEEPALGDGPGVVRDRRVVQAPVGADTQGSKDILEDLLVESREAVAELDEVAPRDRHLLVCGLLRRHVVLVVGEGRVTAHAEVVLDAPLGREAVVVPAQRIEDVLAAHAPVPGHDVGVGVAEDVADVQRARDRRRGGVDRIDRVARRRAVERVDSLLVPALRPRRLEPVDRGLFGDLVGGGGRGVGHGWRSLEQ